MFKLIRDMFLVVLASFVPEIMVIGCLSVACLTLGGKALLFGQDRPGPIAAPLSAPVKKTPIVLSEAEKLIVENINLKRDNLDLKIEQVERQITAARDALKKNPMLPWPRSVKPTTLTRHGTP